MSDNFEQMFREELKQSQKQHKSDDIIDFMEANWFMFCGSKKEFVAVKRELEDDSRLNVSSLCDALNVPESVMFKKIKVADTGKLYLYGVKSTLCKLFGEVYNKWLKETGQSDGSGAYLYLFLIAGDHSLVMTNEQIRPLVGTSMLVCSPRLDEDFDEYFDIYVFPAREIAHRLPRMFNHLED